MNLYRLYYHPKGTKDHRDKAVKATTRDAAKNKLAQKMVLEKVRLVGGKKRTAAQRRTAGAGKHRNRFNRVAFAV